MLPYGVGGPPPLKPVYTIDELLQVEFPPVESYIKRGFLKKSGRMLLAGPSKKGKSFLGVEIARALGSGECVFGYEDFEVPEPVKVLYVDQEIGYQMMQMYRAVAFADSPLARKNVSIVCTDYWIQLDTPQGMQRLQEYVELYKPNVLILDPLNKLHRSDENDNSAINKICNNLAWLVAQYETTTRMSVITMHHFRKLHKEDDPLSEDNCRGAGSLVGDADTIMTVQRLGNVGLEGWEMKCRMILRNGRPMDDYHVLVNHNGQFRAYWVPPEIAPSVVEGLAGGNQQKTLFQRQQR